MPFPKTVILRHRRENRKKCSLRGLENSPDLLFYTYPKDSLPDYSHYLCLEINAPLLSEKDAGKGLFLIDGTWRLAAVMKKQLPYSMEERSLPPSLQSAYPRRQSDCPNPKTGLASVEALFAAYVLLGYPYEHLLKSYLWRESFLRKNFPEMLSKLV